ncbi:MAG: hypothetical protein IKK67_05310 [Bacteroidaceae bacterium]|nr:hypothetical protein [Bacteroidaceae bacterium]
MITVNKAAFGRIVIDGRAYRRITDAETQNILVCNEDGRGGKNMENSHIKYPA